MSVNSSSVISFLILMGTEFIENCLTGFVDGFWSIYLLYWIVLIFFISFIFCLNFHSLLAPGWLINYRIVPQTSALFGNPGVQALSPLFRWGDEYYCLQNLAPFSTLRDKTILMSLRMEDQAEADVCPRASWETVVLSHPCQGWWEVTKPPALFSPQGPALTSLSSSSWLMVTRRCWRYRGPDVWV